jgi:hypothetical protein
MSAKQVVIALDQLANTLLAGGYADETISARAHRLAKRGSRIWQFAETGIDALFFWQKRHCEAAYLSEMQRKQSPREYRA